MDLLIEERQSNSNEEVTILDMMGKITIGEGSPTLRMKVRELLASGKVKLILNFNDDYVPYIDPSGIGELVSAYTAAKKIGGEIKLLNLCRKIEDLLAITKLLTVFKTFKDEEEAVKSFS